MNLSSKKKILNCKNSAIPRWEEDEIFLAVQIVWDVSLGMACRDGNEVCHPEQIFQQHIPPCPAPQPGGSCQKIQEQFGRFPDPNTSLHNTCTPQKGIFQGKNIPQENLAASNWPYPETSFFPPVILSNIAVDVPIIQMSNPF